MHCVDLGESFQTHIFLLNFASIQPRTSPVKFARSSESPPRGHGSSGGNKHRSAAMVNLQEKTRQVETAEAETEHEKYLLFKDNQELEYLHGSDEALLLEELRRKIKEGMEGMERMQDQGQLGELNQRLPMFFLTPT